MNARQILTRPNLQKEHTAKQNISAKLGQMCEDLAEYVFPKHHMFMTRVQPVSRVVWSRKKPTVVYTGRGKGVSDYIGYRLVNGVPLFCACEVKHGQTYRYAASGVRFEQREWLSKLPDGSAFVCVVWSAETPEIFPFMYSGSYQKGTGIRIKTASVETIDIDHAERQVARFRRASPLADWQYR